MYANGRCCRTQAHARSLVHLEIIRVRRNLLRQLQDLVEPDGDDWVRRVPHSAAGLAEQFPSP